MLRRNNAAGSLFRMQWVTGALKTRAESIATRCPIPFSDGAIQFLDFQRRSRCERLENRWSAARKRVSTGMRAAAESCPDDAFIQARSARVVYKSYGEPSGQAECARVGNTQPTLRGQR